MANDDPISIKAVKDDELRAWLESATDGVREVIVEAELPARQVAFQQQPDGGAAPVSMDAGSDTQRESILDELNEQVGAIAGVQRTRVLKAAGAVVVRATADGIQSIAKQPLVKAIRTNRPLK